VLLAAILAPKSPKIQAKIGQNSLDYPGQASDDSLDPVPGPGPSSAKLPFRALETHERQQSRVRIARIQKFPQTPRSGNHRPLQAAARIGLRCRYAKKTTEAGRDFESCFLN